MFTFGLALAMLTLSYFAPRILQRFLMLAAALTFLYSVLAIFSLLSTPLPIHHIIDELSNREKLISAVIFGLFGVFLIAWLVCFDG